jgi:hypothetical protein
MSLEERKKALQEQNKAMTKRLALIKQDIATIEASNNVKEAELTRRGIPLPKRPALLEPSQQADASAAAQLGQNSEVNASAPSNNSIDPEIMQSGITLAGYHIEKGARTFAAYSKAMRADLGDVIKPYLKSWYLAIKYDPRCATFDGMDSAASVDAVDIDAAETPTNC